MKQQILDKKGIAKAVSRIASQIMERNTRVSEIAIIGIQRRGDWLARRIANIIHDEKNITIQVGILDDGFQDF